MSAAPPRPAASPEEGAASATFRPLPAPWTLALGFAAALAYTAIVVVGGWVTPGYDHVREPVSSLYEAGAGNGLPIALAFLGYNLLVMAFGFAMGGFAHALGGRRDGVGIAAGVALLLTGVAGAIDDVFPQDPIGAPITTTGSLHIAFAGMASLATLVAIGLAVAWLLARPTHRPFAFCSVAAFLLILGSGPITAAQTAANSAQMGAWERVTIFTFIVWMGAFSAVLAWRPPVREG